MMVHMESTIDGRPHGLPSDNPPRAPHHKDPKAERSSLLPMPVTLTLCRTLVLLFLIFFRISNVVDMMG